MRLIENINSMIRFVSYLLPLVFLIFGREFIWKILNKLKWHEQEVITAIYFVLIFCASLFAIVAIYKLLHFTSEKRYKQCCTNLTFESRVRIAKLAETSSEVETFFKDNHTWIERDIDYLIDKYSKEISKPDFTMFTKYVNDYALVYFSHRVSERKQFLDILNKL